MNDEPRLPCSALAAVRALLFELDDTLYDRDRAFRGWATAFVARYLDEQNELLRQEAVASLVAWDAHGYCARAVFFAQVQERYGCLPRSVDEMAISFPEQLCRHISLEAETTHLLATLVEWDLPFGIVTNGSAGQRFKVEALGLHHQTSCVFISALFGARKPEQAIFLAAADCLGRTPHEVLFVGDNPEADIVGARNAGMRTACSGLPLCVDPDRWVACINGQAFARKVQADGCVSVDDVPYYVGRIYSGQRVALQVQAATCAFLVHSGGHVVLTLPIKGLQRRLFTFDEFVAYTCAAAHSRDSRSYRSAS